MKLTHSPPSPPEQQSRIRDLAEQLDAHRKKQQAQHAELTLTGMYNVLEKLKSGSALTAKEKGIHEQGLVAVPAARVAWPKELPEQVRLVAQALADARVPLTEDAIAARFQGRGPWKKRLLQRIDTLIVVGRVRVVDGGKSDVIQ